MSILKTVAVALIGAVTIGLNAGVAPAQADDSSPQASIQEDEDEWDDDFAEVDDDNDDDDEDDDGIDLSEIDNDDDDVDDNDSDDIIVEAPDSPSPSTITEIPTPALLPGLIGMGVAALRKRQQEQSESSEE